MYIGLQAECPLYLAGFKETCIFSSHFTKYCNIKFQENSTLSSYVAPCGHGHK